MQEIELEFSDSGERWSDRLPDGVLKLSILICFTLLVILAAVPLDSVSQLYISGGVVAFVYAASSDAFQYSKVREIFRIVALVLGCMLSVRYLIWRGFYTLQTDEIISLILMWVLFLAELYSGLIHLLGCFINVFPINRPLLSLDGYSEEQIPTVDIMIPSYNESEMLLEITLRAALMLKYPKEKLRVHLLDDGGTDQKIAQADENAAREALERRENLQKLCRRLGAQYHTRTKNLNAKAGNINSALKHCDGELTVILDADHVPTADFLSRTVPWMINDDKVFLVQSPHFMANPDPVERNYFSAFTRMPSENDMFYGEIQKGLDFWSSSFFCGSAAVLRRRHLDLVDGIAGESVTEDAETALELHSRGYKSVYVDQPMISGLAPQTFASFIQQRTRWAQGMAQILLIKKPFFRAGLNWYQKFSYMNSILFWMFPFARIAFLLAPLGYLIFGLELIHATLLDIFAYTIPHVVVATRLTTVLFGKSRWPLVSELYEILQCTFILRALFKVFKNLREPSFLVTPKGENLNENYISSLSGIFYWLLLMLGIGNVTGIYHFFAYPLTQEITFFVLLWNSFNFVLFLGLLEVLIEKKQLRHYSRLPAYDDIDVYCENGDTWSGNLVDLSVDGAKLKLSHTRELPDTFTLSVYSNALNQKISLSCRVRYQNINSGEVRIQFIVLNDEDKNKVVALTLCDSARWEGFQKRRTRPVSYFFGVKHVLTVSVKPVFLHIWMKLRQNS